MSRCTLYCGKNTYVINRLVTLNSSGSEADIAAYLAITESPSKQIIFAARGTFSDANWRTNFDFFTVPSNVAEGATVHRGFNNAWNEIAVDVRQAIDDTVKMKPDYKLVITGHSLGGAIATVAAANLTAEGGYEFDLYTYGQPRVGNDKFSDFLSENIPGRLYRVTHDADPVPRLPPAALPLFGLLGYRHTSPEIWLTGEASADPENIAVEDVESCEGNLNFACNANPIKFFNATDHGLYFGKMTCFKDASKDDTVNGVYFPEEVKQQIESEVEKRTIASDELECDTA